MKKKIAITCAVILAVLGLSAFGLFRFVQTPTGIDMILEKVNASIPGTLRLGTLNVCLSDTAIRLTDIEILDPGDAACFKAKEIRCDVTLSSLLKRQLTIREFAVTGPLVDLTVDDKGRINLTDALVKDSPKPPPTEEKPALALPLNIVVEKARIIDGAVAVQNGGNRVSVQNIRVDVTDVDLAGQILKLAGRTAAIRLENGRQAVDIRDIRLTSQLAPGGVATFGLDLASDPLDLTAKGRVTGLFTSPRMDIGLNAVSRLSHLNPLLDLPDPISGRVKTTVSVKGSLDDPFAEITVDAGELALDNAFDNGALQVHVTLADRVVAIEKGLLSLLDSQWSVTGKTDLTDVFPKGLTKGFKDLAGLSYELAFSQEKGDLQKFEKWLPHLSGKFSSSGRITGSGIDPHTLDANCDLSLSLKDFKQDRSGTSPADMSTRLSGRLSGGVFKISECRGTSPGASVSAQGSLDLATEQVDAHIALQAPDLSLAASPFNPGAVKGKVLASVDVSGTITAPSVTADIKANDLATRDIRLNALHFKGGLLPSGTAAIQGLTLENHGETVTLKGAADLFLPGFKLKETVSADLFVSADQISPALFLASPDPELADTRVDFSLNLAGSCTLPRLSVPSDMSNPLLPALGLKAGLDLDEKQLSFSTETFADLVLDLSLSPDVRTYDARVDIRQSDLASLLSTLGIKGVTARVDGRVSAAGRLPVPVPQDLVQSLESARGRMDLAAQVSGPARSPVINGNLKLSGIRYEMPGAGMRISDLSGNIDVTREDIRIEGLKAFVNKGNIALDGHILMEDFKIKGGQIDLAAKALDLPIPSGAAAARHVQVDTLTSRLDLQLNPSPSGDAAPREQKRFPIERITAQADLKTLAVAVKADTTIALSAQFDPAQKRYGMDLKFDATPLEPFFAAAGIPGMAGTLTGRTQTKGVLHADLPVDALKTLKQATGRIECRADLKGTLPVPDATAQIDLKGLSSPIPGLDLSLENLNGRIRAGADLLAMENISGGLGGGRIRVDGKVALEDYRPVKGRINFKGENITVEIPDAAQVEFSSDLTFSGSKDASDLTGTIQLNKGEYYKDFTLDLTGGGGPPKRNLPAEAKKDAQNSVLDRIGLNVDVRSKAPLTLDNNLAFILMEPSLTVTGTPGNPVVTGRAQVPEGVVHYMKNEFDIETGIIDFTDPYKIDPDINLAAQSTIRDWVIHLAVTGKKDNLKFQLYSEPEETHEDILSLIITGKTTKELGRGGGSYTGVLTDKASDIISQGVEESTPLDSFKVGYDDTKSKGGRVSVTMGEKLTKRLEVTYKMETEDEETVHTTAAEYQLMENLMLKAFNDSKGDFGTEFIFKLEFR